MAKDDKKKGFWDDEEEEDSPAKPEKGAKNPRMTGSVGIAGSEEVDRKIDEARTLMDQIHQLYQHYFNGIEKRPPIEKRRLLESKVSEIQRTAAATTASKFKLTQFINLYNTFKDMWDRKLREMEGN